MCPTLGGQKVRSGENVVFPGAREPPTVENSMLLARAHRTEDDSWSPEQGRARPRPVSRVRDRKPAALLCWLGCWARPDFREEWRCSPAGQGTEVSCQIQPVSGLPPSCSLKAQRKGSSGPRFFEECVCARTCTNMPARVGKEVDTETTGQLIIGPESLGTWELQTTQGHLVVRFLLPQPCHRTSILLGWARI